MLVASGLSDLIGVAVLFAWLCLIVLVAGLIAFAVRRRAMRRGTHSLYLLPWYLGFPRRIDVQPPNEERSSRDRTRHP